ncbi:MAG: F0F1 ATP synthase subunit epsilon [bacterium]
MKEMTLEVVTPSKLVFNGKITSITVPGTLGSFQVLFNHAPIISTLEIGIVQIVDTENKIMKYSTSGGTIEVLNNKIIVLAESFEKPEEINLDRAKQALERAKNRLAIGNKEKIDSVRAEASLQRAMNRIKFVQKV